MKLNSRIAVTAMALLMASGGLLYPLLGGVAELGSEVEALGLQVGRYDAVVGEVLAKELEMKALRQQVEQRAFRLLPDDPESHHSVESQLLTLVEQSGLVLVKNSRTHGQEDSSLPSLNWEWVVDGHAESLMRFLAALEDMEWISRVKRLNIQPGSDVRRITLVISVLLEGGDES